jgi:hypothetical protein
MRGVSNTLFLRELLGISNNIGLVRLGKPAKSGNFKIDNL